MSCFIHPERDGVIKCKRCGKEMCEECYEDGQKTGICPSCNLINKVRNLQIDKSNLTTNSIIFGLFCVFLILFVINVALDMFSLKFLIIFSVILVLFGILSCNLFFTSLKKVSKEKQDIILIETANKMARYNAQKEQQIERPKPILSKQLMNAKPLLTDEEITKKPKRKTASTSKKKKNSKKRTAKKSTSKKSMAKNSGLKTKKNLTTKKTGSKTSTKKTTGKKSTKSASNKPATTKTKKSESVKQTITPLTPITPNTELNKTEVK